MKGSKKMKYKLTIITVAAITIALFCGNAYASRAVYSKETEVELFNKFFKGNSEDKSPLVYNKMSTNFRAYSFCVTPGPKGAIIFANPSEHKVYVITKKALDRNTEDSHKMQLASLGGQIAMPPGPPGPTPIPPGPGPIPGPGPGPIPPGGDIPPPPPWEPPPDEPPPPPTPTPTPTPPTTVGPPDGGIIPVIPKQDEKPAGKVEEGKVEPPYGPVSYYGELCRMINDIKKALETAPEPKRPGLIKTLAEREAEKKKLDDEYEEELRKERVRLGLEEPRSMDYVVNASVECTPELSVFGGQCIEQRINPATSKSEYYVTKNGKVVGLLKDIFRQIDQKAKKEFSNGLEEIAGVAKLASNVLRRPVYRSIGDASETKAYLQADNKMARLPEIIIPGDPGIVEPLPPDLEPPLPPGLEPHIPPTLLPKP